MKQTLAVLCLVVITGVSAQQPDEAEKRTRFVNFVSRLDPVVDIRPEGDAGRALEIYKNWAATASADTAIGAPDGLCDPIEACAAPLGGGGSLLVRVASGDLAGCTVTVHEVADRATERFEVWTCPRPVLDATCAGPWFSGGDGEAASGEVGG